MTSGLAPNATHQLADGVYVTFGSPAGFSPNDKWYINTTFPVPARGPLAGNTELVITGWGFLPSENIQCRLFDNRTQYEIVVPAQYDGPTQVRCRTAAHPPDTITDPEYTGLGDPSTLSVGGSFTGQQDNMYTVEILAAGQFKWTQRSRIQETNAPYTDVNSGVLQFPEGASGPGIISGTGTMSSSWTSIGVDTSVTPNVFNGVLVSFNPIAGSASYNVSVGDTFTFYAYVMNDDANSPAGASLPVQLGLDSVRPGVLKQVYVSNDGGVTYSKDESALSTFLYTDIYVSPSGDDVEGDGTANAPYETLQQAVAASLSGARNFFQYSSLTSDQVYQVSGTRNVGLGYTINRDTIIVMDGRYAGDGNMAIDPRGKMLFVKAAVRNNVVIDCQTASSNPLASTVLPNSPLAAVSGSITLRGINVENCAGDQNLLNVDRPLGVF